jgi:hypothetical protein
MSPAHRSRAPYFRNCLALLVAGSALGVAHLDLDPMTAGEDPLGRRATTAPLVLIPPTPAIRVAMAVPEVQQAAVEQASAQQPGAESTGDSPATGSPELHTDDPTTLHGIWALKMTSALLEKGCTQFQKIPDYTATMLKQERIGGALGEVQTIGLKVRHDPFSIYMKWHTGDRGRQLIYVQGQNDGNLLVQPGGIRGRLTGVLNLEPTGNLAMSESRYPITKAGLLELARTILHFQHLDLQRASGFRCQLQDNHTFAERPCWLYVIDYDTPEVNSLYRKSLIYLDKELSMPTCVKNWTWAKDVDASKIDEETLIEFYAYTELQFDQALDSAHFDQHNKDYRMRVR